MSCLQARSADALDSHSSSEGLQEAQLVDGTSRRLAAVELDLQDPGKNAFVGEEASDAAKQQLKLAVANPDIKRAQQTDAAQAAGPIRPPSGLLIDFELDFESAIRYITAEPVRQMLH